MPSLPCQVILSRSFTPVLPFDSVALPPIESLGRQVGTVNRRYTWLIAHCARECSEGGMEGEKEQWRWALCVKECKQRARPCASLI